MRKQVKTDGDLMHGGQFVPSTLRPRVLLADDDPDLRHVIAEVLQAGGFEVQEAQDGVELLNLVAPPRPSTERGAPADLVISDLRMPGLTGLGVLSGLRDRDVRIPFILMTAFGDSETHEQAHRLGVTAVLDKPFDMQSFLGLARACVATF